MAPRKSAAAEVSTPSKSSRQKRSAPNTSEFSARPAKRARRSVAHSEDPTHGGEQGGTIKAEAVGNVANGMNNALDGEGGLEGEAELEAWQDFVMDHYEVVEQLPLELHRNLRLLRELDDDCTAQTGKLHGIIRQYACNRLGRLMKPAGVNGVVNGSTGAYAGADTAKGQAKSQPNGQTMEVETSSHLPPREATEETEEAVEEVEERPAQPPKAVNHVGDSGTQTNEPPAPPPVDEEIHSAEDLGAPLPDGQGGLILPAEPDADASVPPRLPFPDHESADGWDARTQGQTTKTNGERTNLLPEIGRLAREIVRNCEEKLAVATGAYNAIDRHIRALDSALSAQEASILLGLRPDTNPSAAVDTSLNLTGDADMAEGGDDEGLAIGMGGGGRSRSRKKKGKKEAMVRGPAVPVGKAGFPYINLTGVDVDPNEPKYCFCQQASFGEMVGCENDACEYEWFHLPCVGLTTAPTGKWYCLECKPRPGGGLSGTGGIKARARASGKKRRR